MVAGRREPGIPAIPGRTGSGIRRRAGGGVRAAGAAAGQALAEDRERWALWIPVGIGTGIGVYFGLPDEPPAWVGGAGLLLAVVAIGLFRARRVLLVVLLGAVCTLTGFSAAQLRTALVAAPILESRHGPDRLEARVLAVERRPDGPRVTLDELRLDRPPDQPLPTIVRIRANAIPDDLAPNDRVAVRAVLMPPPAPAMPGAYDFQRDLFYSGIGATGYAVSRLEVTGEAAPATAWHILVQLWRERATAVIRAALPGETGAVAAALLTGDRSGLDDDVLRAMRESGLAHLLAISGLHLGLVAGIVFVTVRLGLLLIPGVGVAWPVKKLAAGAALLVAFCYLLLAGATVPTQRAFLMTGLVLLAVMIDRVGISMRLIAWAAAVVLLLRPEALVGPSFQMSFAAVVALVAVYEAIGDRLVRWRRSAGRGRGLVSAVTGTALTSLIATLATAPFALFHFNQFATLGLLANAVAVPATALWVMPWAVLALVLLPFGLAGPPLVPMGWGIDGVLAVARAVADLPGAVVGVPAMPMWGLLLAALGGLWGALWRARWRWLGLPFILAGLCSLAVPRPADILVTGDANLVGVRSADGGLMLSSLRAGRFAAEIWRRRHGVAFSSEPATWPWPRDDGRAGALSRDGRLRCDDSGCVLRHETGGAVVLVAIPMNGPALIADCRRADLVLSLVPERGACGSAIPVIDRFDLWRAGAHAIWLAPEGARVESVRDRQGRRPWARWPAPRTQ